MERFINRYKIKDDIKIKDIINELNAKNMAVSTHGTYIHPDARYSTFHSVGDGDTTICIAFPKKLSEWNSYDYVLVMDEYGGQPYYPFYKAEEDPKFRFVGCLNIIGEYNEFMDSLSFLERIENV